MKLYPNQIVALEYVIERVTKEGRVLDYEIKAQIDQNKRWGAKDRRYFNQAAYDIIRNFELLQFLALENNTSIIGTYIQSMHEFAIDFENIDLKYPNLEFSTRYAIPPDVLKLFREQNANADENLKSMQKIGNIYLRINTSLIPLIEFETLLKQNEIEYKKIEEVAYGQDNFQLNCIQLFQPTQKHKEFFQTYQAFFEIQDIGSQMLTAGLEFKNTKVILESCAGNGGKTAHLIDLTRNENPLIICFDADRKKLDHLQERISKWKNHKVVTEKLSDKDIQKYSPMADLLYLDMPCTGSGTIKRQADIKYRLSQDILNEKINTQRSIFSQFNSTLKSGGKLVYTTCSLFKDENETQIEWIATQGYTIDSVKIFEPSKYDGDGFFIGICTKK